MILTRYLCGRELESVRSPYSVMSQTVECHITQDLAGQYLRNGSQRPDQPSVTFVILRGGHPFPAFPFQRTGAFNRRRPPNDDFFIVNEKPMNLRSAGFLNQTRNQG